MRDVDARVGGRYYRPTCWWAIIEAVLTLALGEHVSRHLEHGEQQRQQVRQVPRHVTRRRLVVHHVQRVEGLQPETRGQEPETRGQEPEPRVQGPRGGTRNTWPDEQEAFSD